jgi:hypothetical protein
MRQQRVGRILMDLGTQLPIRYHQQSSWVPGIFICLFASPFLFIGLSVIYSFVTGNPLPVPVNGSTAVNSQLLVPGIIFSVLGGSFFLIGLSLFGSTDIKIEGGIVSYAKKNVWKQVQWREGLASFNQIVTEEIYHPGGKNSSGYTEYKIELGHQADPKKNIPLYITTASDHTFFRQRSEILAKAFKLPLQAKGAGGKARAVEDLDKTLKDMLRENKIQYQHDPNKFPEIPGVEFARMGEETKMIVQMPGAIGTAAMIFVVFVGFILYPIIHNLYMALFLVLGIGIAVKIMVPKVRYLLILRRDGITHMMELFQYKLKEEFMPWKGMEEITTFQRSGGHNRTLRLSSDQKVFEVGMGFTDKGMEWLKNAVLYYIDRYSS